ncbi:hypothetical protein [Streptomyces sp. enrichment culture]|uniref:hypothetical protein n=1 Tax=Streptomyces sp. enrichment culture TaxID=1795815 RepID=UPI003F576890
MAVTRTAFHERREALVHDYRPRPREADATRFTSEAQALEDFAAAGFTVREVLSFARPVTPGLRAYHARMAKRPRSSRPVRGGLSRARP